MLKNVHPQVADSGFDSFRQTAAACEGYLIERLLFSRIADSGTLDIGLRWGPEKPDITLSFQNVHHFSASGLPDVSAGPLDQITTTVLDRAMSHGRTDWSRDSTARRNFLRCCGSTFQDPFGSAFSRPPQRHISRHVQASEPWSFPGTDAPGGSRKADVPGAVRTGRESRFLNGKDCVSLPYRLLPGQMRPAHSGAR